MKSYTKTFKSKIKILVIIIFLLIIPFLLNAHFLRFVDNFNSRIDNKSENNDNSLKSSAPPNANQFTYYKTITIDHNKVAGSVDYSNFPVLISIIDPDLKTDVQSDGDDIAFSTENTWLDHEIETFNQGFNSTHAQLIAWVRVPTLSGITDTFIRMYYGNSTMSSRQNPSGVWEVNHRGVWHLNELSGGTNAIIDSTSYSNDGTDVNNPQLGENGQISNSIGFNDASGQRIEVSDDTSLDISNQLTVEAWINPNVATKWMTIVSKMAGTWGSGSVSNFDIYVAINDMGYYDIGLSNPSDIWDEWHSSVSVSTGTWQHFVFTYQSSTSMGRIFVNGMFMESYDFGIGTLGTNGNPFYIGFNRGWTGEVFDGLIDEVRISSIPRSAGWINTEYVNQYDPASFYSIGPEQSVSSEPLNADYFMYYKIFTIDQNEVAGTGSHINFPMLISIIDDDLKYHSQPDGDDIAFSIGGEWLNHEIELFNQTYSATQAQLVVWVQIPFLSTSTNTSVTMYYGNSTMTSQGNPSAVWSSSYVGVYHLNENPGGTVYDSTSNNNDGTTLGSMDSSDLVSSQVGKGYELDGLDDMISVSDSTSLDSVNDEGTMSLWINWIDSSAGRYQRIMTTSNRFTANPTPPPTLFQTDGFEWAVQPDGDLYFYPYGGNTINYNLATNPFTNSNWHYIVVTLKYSTRSVQIYLDGTSLIFSIENVPSQWSILANLDNWLWGGNNIATGSQFEGLFDEIRVSNIERSASWILTEFNNQFNPNSFYSVGSEHLVSDQPSNYGYFNYYKTFTVDHTKINGTGSHVNFPLLISIQDEDLRYDVQNDGDDIAFSMDGIWLDHQIEQFNQSYSSSHAQLITWVRIPFLSTAFDTNITMYYGNFTMSSQQNPTGVWYSEYSGVWHLNDDPSGIPPQIKDSTIPASDGATYGSMASSDRVSGMVGRALDFDGINDYIDFGNPAEMQITGEITVQAWFKVDYVGNDYLIAKHGGTGYRGWDISFDDDPGIAPDGWIMFRYSPDGINTISTGYERVRVNQWYHVVGVFKPNEYSKLFFNGTQVSITTTGVPPSMNDPALPLRIARRSDAATSYVDGIIDEVRISNIARSNEWIYTEYINQKDPSSFYSIGLEQSLKPQILVQAQLNAIDLYGNLLPDITISLYQYTQLIERGTTYANGSILFSQIIEGEYNFTATIRSDIANVTELVNITSQAILLDQPFQSINLVCDVSSHFFEVTDIDGIPLESGWIMVGNDTHTIKKCYLDPTGRTRFWWVDAPPSEYNYTVYYQDAFYNPSTLALTSGDITTVNTTIHLQVELTTVEFTIQTINVPISPVSGAKLKLTVDDPLGASIVNLTTDINGKATLRWLNSTGIGGDYALQIEFFGVNRLFNDTTGGPAAVYNVSFSVVNKDSLEFRISIDLSKFQTELLSLSPSDYIEIEWGSVLKLRTLFNVSKVESGYEPLLGPTTADSMKYELLLGGISIQSGSFNEEIGNIGRHYVEIDTKQVNSDEKYIIIISAHKSGFTIPSNLILQLNVLNNEIEVNQSDNDDSALTTYWSESVNMTLNSYGTSNEMFTVKNAFFQNVDHEFNFLISDVQNHWNLSKIEFNIYGISWNVDIANINITIEDPYGGFVYTFDNNTNGWDYTQGTWTGITIILNSASRNKDNNFEFIISGTFDGSVDIVANAYFIRDSLSIQYSKFNVSDQISLLTETEGWSINNITFEIASCYYSSNWSVADLTSLTDLNITTNEGFTYSLDVGYFNGTGVLTIDDRIIYPIGNQFLFRIESKFDLIFNTVIKVDYFQEFYVNQFLETYNLTSTSQGIPNGGLFLLNAADNSWKEQEAYIWVTGITNGISYFFPSEVGMTITIGSQTYSISDYAQGTGRFSLAGFTRNQILQANIDTSSSVNFSLLLSIKHFRQISYEIVSSLSYFIVESPSIFGPVQYNLDLGYYLKTITTSLLDANEYTVRFSIIKEHYASATKDLELIILNRPTLLNSSPEFFRTIENIYVKDALNFTFVYTDALNDNRLTNLRAQYYIWESYDQEGNVKETGQGNIISAIDNTYIVDFDTETKAVGEYLLVLTMDKDNYDRKNGMILLTINKRLLNYSLGTNFENYRTSIAQGKVVLINISLTDPTQGGIPLMNATVKLAIGGITYDFQQSIGNVTGFYIFELHTDNINTFFGSETLTGIINITRTDYISEEFTIIIIVKMEEIFPGIPTFYFILVLSAIVALVGSIGGYKVYQNAKIPTFVKKVREMEKAIKKDKQISESVLYPNKNVFVAEKVNHKWEKLGLSLANIIDTEGEKIKKVAREERRISGMTKEHKLRPIGLILMKWDERIGTEILAKYPEETVISEKTLMQIYSTHEYSGDKGLITLSAGALNILSYYSGPETGHYLLLVLNLDDDPDLYEGGMADTLRTLLENVEDDSYYQLMPSLFQRLSLFPSLTDEQNLALSYQDGVKHTIINNLRDIGLITKSELAVWLKDKFVYGFLDLESTLSELIKKEFIKQVSVKGVPSELIVLINDIFMLRVPPVDIYKNPVNRGLPKQFTKEYLAEVKQFFQNYKPTKEDSLHVLDILVNPEVYQILRLLRTKITTRDDLEKLRVKGVEDIYGALKLLFDAGMIKVLQDDNKNEYYALLTDFYMDLIFPKYLLKVIKMAYDQKSVTNNALIEYLKILEEVYFDLKSKYKLLK